MYLRAPSSPSIAGSRLAVRSRASMASAASPTTVVSSSTDSRTTPTVESTSIAPALSVAAVITWLAWSSWPRAATIGARSMPWSVIWKDSRSIVPETSTSGSTAWPAIESTTSVIWRTAARLGPTHGSTSVTAQMGSWVIAAASSACSDSERAEAPAASVSPETIRVCTARASRTATVRLSCAIRPRTAIHDTQPISSRMMTRTVQKTHPRRLRTRWAGDMQPSNQQCCSRSG